MKDKFKFHVVTIDDLIDENEFVLLKNGRYLWKVSASSRAPATGLGDLFAISVSSAPL